MKSILQCSSDKAVLFYLMPTPHKPLFIPHAVYRASFPETYSEIRKGRGDYKIVVPAVTGMILFAIWLASFLRKSGAVDLYTSIFQFVS